MPYLPDKSIRTALTGLNIKYKTTKYGVQTKIRQRFRPPKRLLGARINGGFLKNLAGLYVLNLGNIATNIDVMADFNLKNAAK